MGSECDLGALTWNVHAPECNRLQSIHSKSVTRVEESLNCATEVLASGVDFAIGLPNEVVGELLGLVGDFRAIPDTIGVPACGQQALFEDFNRCLETVGVL